jgi:hypothetical protein|tara:strand:+ start:369 stop:527 length:159 start_codon:yes stop_codon:yes gene_type:complete
MGSDSDLFIRPAERGMFGNEGWNFLHELVDRFECGASSSVAPVESMVEAWVD